ncbi:MAG: gluconeogenesis factor YvcK family protein [Nanoarchaeota archaeon]
MQKIVTIGGGTGHYQLLRGLKIYDCSISAVVNMSDGGGSSGRLRDEYGVLPPGDVRQCMVALSDHRVLRDLFNFRFKDGHAAGNLIITALTEIFKDPAVAIKEAGKLLNIRGKILPVTIDDVVLCAETENGKILRGEPAVSYPSNCTQIKKLFLEPSAFLYREAGEEIRKADKIVICSGEIHGSILPNFLVNGMKEALSDSNAMKIYICNLFTKEGSYNFKASDFVQRIQQYSGITLDKIIINNKMPSEKVLEKYLAENSKLVENNLNDSRVVLGDFIAEYPSERKTLLRHVPEKIAKVIVEL